MFARPSNVVPPKPISEPVPTTLSALLRSARHALANDHLDRAIALATQVLEGDGGSIAVPPRARLEAFEVWAWAEFLRDNTRASLELLERARAFGEPEVSLSAAVLLSTGELKKARQLIEAARARGDDRKEVVGTLIQVLIRQGEVAHAVAVALEIVDGLSNDDVRKMAQIGVDHGAFEGGARLFEVGFDREKLPEDAYDAARARAQAGQPDRALDMLRRAVEAGFSDGARAWSDAAFETLRATQGLDALLPRP